MHCSSAVTTVKHVKFISLEVISGCVAVGDR